MLALRWYLLLALLCIGIKPAGSSLKKEVNVAVKLMSAKAIDKNHIQATFNEEGFTFRAGDVSVTGAVEVNHVEADGRVVTLATSELSRSRNCYVEIGKYGRLPVDLGVLFDEIVSGKPLGFQLENGATVFRIFAPRATTVTLVLFEKHDVETGAEHEMKPDENGVWEVARPGELWGKYYGYRIDGPRDAFEKFTPDKVIADPYSKAVVSKNTYLHESRSIILRTDDYDWQGDSFVTPPWQDLIIYEMHVRDLTAHPSAGARQKGTYLGLVEKGGKGGIEHILELGVNAVELLPCQDFGNIEIPYGVEVNGVTNTWNPYERNHWGYMTSYFFAPESYYASAGNMETGAYNGIRGQQVNEFKDMVKAFHKEGIAVIMDVVYNHVSQYDLNPFKYTDKQYFFKLDAKLNFTDSGTGCGNEVRTARPMARRMIIDSIKYWLREFHIDGFRLDLAAVFDWETVDEIMRAARKINPNVILIAEPWSLNDYQIAGFSEHGWAAWNDQFRNGIKGQNPRGGLGFIFGNYWNDNSVKTMQNYVRGSLKEYGGPFVSESHSVNYLESHDDNTLGDFIRIGAGKVKPDQRITDLEANAKLTPTQLKLNKLAAVLLMTSQGATMLHEGQEFARSKVIAPTDAPDPQVGRIDHNSYNKDNETNWLNFDQKELNRELFDFYRGLIHLRREHPAFRRTKPGTIRFLNDSIRFALGFHLLRSSSGDAHDFVVLVNANPTERAKFVLPQGQWRKVVGQKRAGIKVFGQTLQGGIMLPSRTALVLKSMD